MTTQTEALKLALEALESCGSGHITDGGNQWYDEKLVDNSITAIKEALAQPEHEPVAWWHPQDCDFEHEYKEWMSSSWIPLYTTPPQRKPLIIGKESAEFAKWFDAVWLGDGEQGETIPTSGKEYDDYLSQYTLAFGAWMAAKEAAHGIKE